MTVPRTITHADLAVPVLGPGRFDSPMAALLGDRQTSAHYVNADDRVLLDDTLAMAAARGVPVTELPAFEAGGPRRQIYFDPRTTRAAIVTCGGLCPGLNDVIRALVLELTGQYGVETIYGFRNGYQGLVPGSTPEPTTLTPEVVARIHEQGGTILGTSRGAQDPDLMLDRLVDLGINLLFVIGGDGSMRGAQGIVDAATARGVELSVIGIPKTIDNDIPFIDHSFGFQTAFAVAKDAIRAAYIEATAVPDGVGLVKLMGRHSGFIACYAALANNDADFVLVPEVDFRLEGPSGLLAQIRRRVAEQGHAVVVTAEGAGQHLLQRGSAGTDASGNTRLHDIGQLLRQRITDHFAAAEAPLTLRYLDPSYAIRSVPANAYDAAYCVRLAHAAVHAAMAGRTGMVVGRWHGRFVHLPIPLATGSRNQVDPHGDLWMAVLEATGQGR
jgi:6-phosphofructokinase 1